jgi:hypothetical protein
MTTTTHGLGRLHISAEAREFLAAAIATAGVILLLPGASIVMAALRANGLA